MKPYTAVDDERVSWLKDVFIKYLEDWQLGALTQEGKYTAEEHGRMFLSAQTFEGLKISVYSYIEAIQFLLQKDFQYVLSEQFMQHIVQDYFGHQREQGWRSDNPTAQQFGCKETLLLSSEGM